MVRINGVQFVGSLQMAFPRRAKARTNWCSFIAAYTLSDCAYSALFSLPLVPKQLLVFLAAHSLFPPPGLDSLRAAMVNSAVVQSVAIGRVWCWHADLHQPSTPPLFDYRMTSCFWQDQRPQPATSSAPRSALFSADSHCRAEPFTLMRKS